MEKQWTVNEIRELYVDNNYSMVLVSRLTHIRLPELSRAIQKYGLNKEKEKLYGPDFSGEKNSIPKADGIYHASAPGKNAEDAFFDGL